MILLEFHNRVIAEILTSRLEQFRAGAKVVFFFFFFFFFFEKKKKKKGEKKIKKKTFVF